MSFGEIVGIRKLESLDYLSCGVVCVILRLAVPVEHRLVTDRQTDGQTDTRRQLIPALASIARAKLHVKIGLAICWQLVLLASRSRWGRVRKL